MANGLNIFSPVPVVFFFFQCWLDSFADLTGFLSPNFKLMFQAWFVCLTRTLTSTTSHLYHITDHSTSRTQPTQHKAKALLEMWTKQDGGCKNHARSRDFPLRRYFAKLPFQHFRQYKTENRKTLRKKREKTSVSKCGVLRWRKSGVLRWHAEWRSLTSKSGETPPKAEG